MKTDQELVIMAQRIHGEVDAMQLGPLRTSEFVIKRLRQLEHDAILDFVESLKDITEAFHDPTPTSPNRYVPIVKTNVIEFRLKELGITRAPSGGCKDGRCGGR